MRPIVILPLLLLGAASSSIAGELPYPIVDTGQVTFYDDSRGINPPGKSDPFHGQDAGYTGNKPSYRDNGDGYLSPGEFPMGPPTR